MHHIDIVSKAHRVLHIVVLAFMLIIIRVFFLSTVNYEKNLSAARIPQKKIVIESANRGTIRDRFNKPLAVNSIEYNAAILFEEIRKLPRVRFIKNDQGLKEKIFPRKKHIHKICQILSKELSLSEQYLEDLIYAKAALFPHLPFIIQWDISEKLYYRLKRYQRELPGIYPMQSSKRFYPKGKVGCDIIGHLGAINAKEYHKLASEISDLTNFLTKKENGEPIFLPKGYYSVIEVEERLEHLMDKSYSFHDIVGKTGIENKYDDQLRGTIGKKIFAVDNKGSIIKKLPGSTEPHAGNRLYLNISSELQEFCEMLLAENELIRDQNFPNLGKEFSNIAPPWIKGGAIVAMIPQTGEVVTLASYPRYDPNTFITTGDAFNKSIKQENIHNFLETDKHIASIWDGKQPLKRELVSPITKQFYMEQKNLTWDIFLDMSLALKGSVRKTLQRIRNIEIACTVQKTALTLLDLSEQPNMAALIDTIYSKEKGHYPSRQNSPQILYRKIEEALEEHEDHVKVLTSHLDNYLIHLPHNNDKLLVLDLIRLCVPGNSFSEDLLVTVGQDTLSVYRKLSQAASNIHGEVQKIAQSVFHEYDFDTWRKLNFSSFIALKRIEEKNEKKYQKPFTDYLELEEKRQFQIFWKENKDLLLALFLYPNHFRNVAQTLIPYAQALSLKHSECLSPQKKFSPFHSSFELLKNRLDYLDIMIGINYFATMRSFEDLNLSLFGEYPILRGKKGFKTEQALASVFYPRTGYGYMNSYAFSQATPLGSIFKLIVGYEALYQKFMDLQGRISSLSDLNPLTLQDFSMKPIDTPKGVIIGYYENGLPIYRSHKGGRLPRSHANIGRVDFLTALERSSNLYFCLLAGEVIRHPNQLIDASLQFGLGQKTGIDLPNEFSGFLPTDIYENKTSLYSFAFGQHSLLATPLQTAVMLSCIANAGTTLHPQLIKLSIGDTKEKTLDKSLQAQHYPYAEYLHSTGIYFPFFLETLHPSKKTEITQTEKTILKKIPFPKEVRDYLLEGMHRVVDSSQGHIRYLYSHPTAMRDFNAVRYNLAGKTSTAEILYHPTLDQDVPSLLCKDIWFGAISFHSNKDKPLVKIEETNKSPELVVVVYLKFGDYGKEAEALAAQVVAKWRELCKRYGAEYSFEYEIKP